MCQPVNVGERGSGEALSRRIHSIGNIGVYQGEKEDPSSIGDGTRRRDAET